MLIGPNFNNVKRFQNCMRVEEKICCDRFLLTSEKCSTEDFRKEPKNRGGNAGFAKQEWESRSGNSCKHGRVFVVKNMGSQLYGRFIQLTKRWPVDEARLGR